MFKIPKSVEYAIFALKFIHECGDNSCTCVSAKEISEGENIPYELSAKILQKLKKHGLIESQHGTKGGYSLALPADKIKLIDILAAVGQNIRVTECMFDDATVSDCKRIESCCIRTPLSRIQNKIKGIFNETTLMEVI